jgi:hypothetical protein
MTVENGDSLLSRSVAAVPETASNSVINVDAFYRFSANALRWFNGAMAIAMGLPFILDLAVKPRWDCAAQVDRRGFLLVITIHATAP